MTTSSTGPHGTMPWTPGTSPGPTRLAGEAAGRTPTAPVSPTRRSRLLPATLVGLLLALVVAFAGIALIARQQAAYSATASLLVLPERQADPNTAASLYDSLSSGQVVQSYRAVMDSPGFVRATLDGLGLAPQVREGLTPDVHVVPETALVDATVTARTPGVAERAADALAARAEGELSTTFRPYRITVVSAAEGTAKRSGAGKGTLLGVVLLIALVVGVLAQQAVLFATNARERAAERRRRTPTDPPAAGGGTVARAG